MTTRGRVVDRVAQGAAAIGFLLLLWVLLGLRIDGMDGSGGTDALAYWRGGRAILDGTDLYGGDPGATSAYLYSPLFAQVVAPLALLPSVTFVWVWRLAEIGCLRIATGSWTRAGIAALIFPPVIIELAYGNVNLMLAAACALVMRGRVWPWSIPVAAKLAGLPLAPLAFFTDRKTFLKSAAVLSVVVGASVFIAPSLWSDYASLLTHAQEPTGWTNLSRGIPLVPRLAVSVILGVAAVRWIRLAPIAMLAGLPIVWLTSTSILVAVIVPLAARNPRTPADAWGAR